MMLHRSFDHGTPGLFKVILASYQTVLKWIFGQVSAIVTRLQVFCGVGPLSGSYPNWPGTAAHPRSVVDPICRGVALRIAGDDLDIASTGRRKTANV